MAFNIESSLLDACALAILTRGDTYGYEITQSMKQAIVVSESTLYPVLRRLQKENFCRLTMNRIRAGTEDITASRKKAEPNWKNTSFSGSTIRRQ